MRTSGNRVGLGLSNVSISREITRQQETENLRLEYSDVDESWRAWDGEKEVSAELNTRRAEFLLTTLEGLRVDRWLARDDTDAAAALVNPMLRFRIIRTKVDDDGEWLSIDPEVFEFSPIPVRVQACIMVDAEPIPIHSSSQGMRMRNSQLICWSDSGSRFL